MYMLVHAATEHKKGGNTNLFADCSCIDSFVVQNMSQQAHL